MKFKKIFLTGGSGWLGSQIIETLLNGDDDVIENFNWSGESLKVFHYGQDNLILDKFPNEKRLSIYNGNLTLYSDCKSFLSNSNDSLLIHTAGIIHPKKIKDFYTLNLESTKSLVNNAINNGVKKIVIVSSNSPLGCNDNKNEYFDENSEYNPYMNYGKSKMLMEMFLLEKIHEGHDITIIRPPWFYGENMPDRQIQFYKMIQKGVFPIIGNGENVRSKANVKNIVQGIILASQKPISKGKIYWIADEKSYTMNEIISTIKSVLENEYNIKCSDRLIKLPFMVGQLAEYIDFFLQKIGVYNQKFHVLSEMNKNIACNIDKAKEELGYSPKLSLYEGTKLALKNIKF